GVPIRQQLPVKFQVEGTELIRGADVLKAIGTHQGLEAAGLDSPTMGGEGLIRALLPSFAGGAVEEQAPALLTLGVGEAILMGKCTKPDEAQGEDGVADRKHRLASKGAQRPGSDEGCSQKENDVQR